MTEKYQEFLKKLNIIQEEEFNEVIETLPEFDMKETNIDWYGDIEDQQALADALITSILETNWDATVDYVNWDYKSFDLDCSSIEDLEEIRDTFSNWSIENYEELEEDLKEKAEVQSKVGIMDQLNRILDKIPEEELTNLYEKYAN